MSPTIACLNHLRRLTDPRGLLHAAIDDCPDRSQGYDSMDNADALRLCAVASDTVSGETLRQLARTYFGFLTRARQPDGRVQHRCDPGGVWMNDREDALVQSRLARALAGVIVSELPIRLRLAAAEWWTQLLPAADEAFTAVAAANWLMAIGTLRCADPGRDLVRAAALANWLVEECYTPHRSAGWEWFESNWTAGSATIPAALWHAQAMLGETRFGQVALATTTFVIQNLFKGDLLMPAGTQGGWNRHNTKALFDQLPSEAAAIVELCRTAETLSGNPGFHDYALQAIAWFTGNNVQGASLLNVSSGGCHAGLCAGGLNRNQDAPAAIAFLLAHANLSESAPIEASLDSHIVIG